MIHASAQPRTSWEQAKQAPGRLKREVLLTEAAILFSHKGYSATSLDDIVARLNITKTAIYYYVKNKNDLLYQCYLRSLDATESCYDEAERQGKTGLDKLLCYLRLDAESGPLSMAPLTELDAIKDSTARKALAKRLHLCEQRFQSFIVEGIRDGSIAPCDPELVMQFVLGSSRWIMKWYAPDSGHSLPDINTALMGFVRNGLCPREIPRS